MSTTSPSTRLTAVDRSVETCRLSDASRASRTRLRTTANVPAHSRNARPPTSRSRAVSPRITVALSLPGVHAVRTACERLLSHFDRHGHFFVQRADDLVRAGDGELALEAVVRGRRFGVELLDALRAALELDVVHVAGFLEAGPAPRDRRVLGHGDGLRRVVVVAELNRLLRRAFHTRHRTQQCGAGEHGDAALDHLKTSSGVYPARDGCGRLTQPLTAPGPAQPS